MIFRKPQRKVNRVFIHCSASDNPDHDDISVIEKWHKERRFAGVGYHYFITKNGDVQIGRELERSPAAQRGHNKGTIAICLHGLKDFTEDQFDALAELCSRIDAAYRHDITFHGHCEVSSKTCPVFDYKFVLDLTDRGYMRKAKPISGNENIFTNRPLHTTRSMRGAGIATLGTAGAAASDVVTEAADKIEPISHYSDALQAVFIILILLGIGLSIYARVDDRKKGYR